MSQQSGYSTNLGNSWRYRSVVLVAGRAVLVAFMALMMAAPLLAQEAETRVEGIVRARGTEAPVPGATVLLEGTDLQCVRVRASHRLAFPEPAYPGPVGA